MGLLSLLHRSKQQEHTWMTQPSEFVVIDNRFPNDNWLTNEVDIPVWVACRDQGGAFTIRIRPGQSERISAHVQAAPPVPYSNYSYDHLDYSLKECSEWAVRREAGKLVLVKVRTWPKPSRKSWEPPGLRT